MESCLWLHETTNLFSSSEQKFPSFSKAKHKLLCSELKQLYVAITRTRQRLWICENIDEFSKPMYEYWKESSLVQVRELDESLAHAMKVASSKEEWLSRGIKLFNERNYEMATMCFERAGDLKREKWAKASGLRAAADRLQGSNSELARIALMEAAEIYESIGKNELAAECFIELKEFKRAGALYWDKCDESYLEVAGDCFHQAECWGTAAEVYCKANCLTKCLVVCTNGNLFDKGLDYIRNWKESANLDADTVKSQELKQMEQSFLERCALHYHQLKDTNSMVKFVRAFSSMEEKRAFLRTRNYLGELILLEAESGNFTEAASVARWDPCGLDGYSSSNCSFYGLAVLIQPMLMLVLLLLHSVILLLYLRVHMPWEWVRRLRMYKKANGILGFDLLDICTNGPKDKLDSTVVSQPAIYVTSLAAVEVLRARDGGRQIIDSVDVTCGLSLGEYTALEFAGAFRMQQKLCLLHRNSVSNVYPAMYIENVTDLFTWIPLRVGNVIHYVCRPLWGVERH